MLKRALLCLLALAFFSPAALPAAVGNGKASETVEIFSEASGKVETVPKIMKTDAEWKKILTPEQYQVMRSKGTDRAFSKQCAIPRSGKGIYQCAACGTDLFKYGNKFESGTGWPSFWNPVSEKNVVLKEDDAFGMHRVEVLCARCESHLGHIFDDGPPPTGKRFCINATALKLAEKL